MNANDLCKQSESADIRRESSVPLFVWQCFKTGISINPFNGSVRYWHVPQCPWFNFALKDNNIRFDRNNARNLKEVHIKHYFCIHPTTVEYRRSNRDCLYLQLCRSYEFSCLTCWTVGLYKIKLNALMKRELMLSSRATQRN